MQLALLPFGEHAPQHFLYLERPEGMELEDAPEFAALALPTPSLTLDDDRIVPQSQEFATIGHLYRGLEQGFRHLVEEYGESRIFIGPPRTGHPGLLRLARTDRGHRFGRGMPGHRDDHRRGGGSAR